MDSGGSASIGFHAKGSESELAMDDLESGEEMSIPRWSVSIRYALLCIDASEAVAFAIARSFAERMLPTSDTEAQEMVELVADAGFADVANDIACARGNQWLVQRRLDCAMRWFAHARDRVGMWKASRILL